MITLALAALALVLFSPALAVAIGRGIKLADRRKPSPPPPPKPEFIRWMTELPPVPLTASERAWLKDQPIDCLSDNELNWRFQDAIRFEKWSGR